LDKPQFPEPHTVPLECKADNSVCLSEALCFRVLEKPDFSIFFNIFSLVLPILSAIPTHGLEKVVFNIFNLFKFFNILAILSVIGAASSKKRCYRRWEWDFSQCSFAVRFVPSHSNVTVHKKKTRITLSICESDPQPVPFCNINTWILNKLFIENPDFLYPESLHKPKPTT